MTRVRAAGVLLLAAALIWGLPLLGLLLAGHPIVQWLAFPPRTRFSPHAPFDWGAFVTLALPAAGMVALYAILIARAQVGERAPAGHRFPWWAWLGAALMAASWFAAWHEGALPPEWRRHVFTPLWLGYIFAMNGLVLQRTGRSLLTHRCKWFLALFPVSSAFWWLFEHLNQFVGNWYYAGIQASGDLDYFLQATLPFATVLPAVASTWSWLRTVPRLDAMNLPAVRGSGALACVALGAGILALGGIGVWSEALFPMLWLAPLLVIGGLQHLLLGETLFRWPRDGDWRPLLQPALAAMICGLLWELWNFGSVAKWHYSIPYVQRFHVFEMPLLGYGGYLPFGIECALVMDLVARMVEGRGVWPLEPG
jgi:hypothetical protein